MEGERLLSVPLRGKLTSGLCIWQWSKHSQPNWIYPACNLVGMEGALAYDSYMQTGQAAQMLHDSFHRKFEEEFMNPDGSVVTIRSALS